MSNQIPVNISIPENYLNEILKVIGYPLISLDDLEIDEKNLKQLIIFPSMREFFKWFPIPNIVEYMAEDSFTIDFPDLNTFTLIDIRLNTAGFGVRDSVNPFVNNSVYRAINTTSSYGGGIWGTKYDYDYRVARLYDRMERQSLIDTNKAFRVDIDHAGRKIVGFSNIMGKLVVTWGKFSTNFSDIQFQRIDEVIKLAQGNLLTYLGMLRNQQTPNLPNNFNAKDMIEKGDKLITEIIKKWQEFSKVPIIRG